MDLLNYIIAPSFANGTSDVEDLIDLIKGAKDFKLSQYKYYLSNEGSAWVENQLPKMGNEIQREVDKCWEELKE